MRRSSKFLLPMLATSLLLAACGSSSSSSSSPATPPVKASVGSSGSVALVTTAANSKLGATVLVNARGLTLYHLSGEQNGKFICTSQACVQVWHPLINHSASPKASVGSLGTVKRPGGSIQVTYKGMPLYTFAHDTAPGQANGQGIKDVGVWTAAATGAKKGAVPAAPAASSTASSTSKSYGY